MRVAGLVLVLLFLSPPRAQAQPEPTGDRDRATALLQEGTSRFDVGDYLGALEKYQQAYATYPSPNLLMGIGTSLWNLGRFTEAAAAFERYLREAPADGTYRSEAESHVAALDQLIGKLAITVDQERAVLLVDGQRVASDEGSVTVRVDPGAHVVVANKPGFQTASVSIEVSRGEESTVPIHLAPVPKPGPPQIVEKIVVRDRVVKTRGKIAGSVQVVADPVRLGGAALAGASYGLLDRVDVGGGAIFGPHPGVFLQGTLFLSRGALRPLFALATPTFLVDGAVLPGIRGAAGLEWIPSLRVGLVVQVAVEHYPTAGFNDVATLFAPSIGVQTRL